MYSFVKLLNISNKLFLFFAALFFLNIQSGLCQGTTIDASLDTNSVKIGDQFHLFLKVKTSPNHTITWPSLPDTLGKIEIVEKPKIDTAKTVGSNTVTLTHKIKLMSFDTGYFVIPSFKILSKSKSDTTTQSFESRALFILVKGIAVDTTKEIKDIKPPLEVPFSVVEFLKENGIIIGGIVGVLLLAALAYYYLRNKKPTPKPVYVKPSRPAHEIALEQLNLLEKEKLWQQGQVKTYHTQLTDIIRTYIEHRYNVPAMEQTTDEIISSLSHLLPSSMVESLKTIFTTADLAKFAKMQPVSYENEASMKYAKEFVGATKEIGKPLEKGGTQA